MSNSLITIGIDKRDTRYYAARVDRQTGRPEVKALLRFELDSFSGHHLLEGGDIVTSIPDEKVVIKKIKLESDENYQEIAKFEMKQSQIDDTDNYLFDTIKTNLSTHYLGLILRKAVFSELTKPFTDQESEIKINGKMRTQALLDGFLFFCRHNGGDLGAVLDLTTKRASFGFYYKQNIIDLMSFSLENYDLNDIDSLTKLSIELKTVLNFKKASFFDLGISLPISGLYILSETIDNKQIDFLKEALKLNILRPEINSGFLSNRKDSDDISLDNYLVALGLTVY